MSSAGSERGGAADLYVTAGMVVLVQGAVTPWRHEADTLADGLSALVDRWREVGGSTRVRVWLGASLCRPVRLAPVAGARTRAERLRLAELSAAARSGLAGPCRVSVDESAVSDDIVAIVVQEPTVQAVEQALASAKRRVVSIRPWWSQALDAALKSNPALRALSVWEGRALTCFTGEGRVFASAQTAYPVEDAESAAAIFARALVSGMIPQDDALAVRLDWSADPQEAAKTDAVFTPWVRRLGAGA